MLNIGYLVWLIISDKLENIIIFRKQQKPQLHIEVILNIILVCYLKWNHNFSSVNTNTLWYSVFIYNKLGSLGVSAFSVSHSFTQATQLELISRVQAQHKL